LDDVFDPLDFARAIVRVDKSLNAAFPRLMMSAREKKILSLKAFIFQQFNYVVISVARECRNGSALREIEPYLAAASKRSFLHGV
jgi:hypothetical protein